MKLKNVFVKTLSLTCIGVAALVSSCMDEERLTLQDTQDISEEALTDSYFQDLDDMAGVSMDSQSSEVLNGGRTSSVLAIDDDRFTCAEVTLEVTGNPDAPAGVLTVDFGTTGCTDSKGNIRTGKLIFTYSGRRFQPGSTVVTTVDNYIVNRIKLEGTRTLTNVTSSTETSPKFNAVLANGKATFLDDEEKIATRISNITWQWVRGTTVAGDYLLIAQGSEASGVTRGGRNYEVNVTEGIKFKRICGGIPVDGIKTYRIEGDKIISIDYGDDDGTCDRKITVIVNGVARSLTVD